MAKRMKPQEKVLALKTDSVISYMRDLRGSMAYEVLMGLLANQRDQIIFEGKRAKEIQARADAMLRLDGFDMATMMISKWANKKTKDEVEQQDTPFNG